MCLGLPMRVVEHRGRTAWCEAGGLGREVDLFLLQHEPVAPGDWVLVHVGYAIQRLDPEAGEAAWA
ncbi:MAG: HypC/HybG/HupF family hydrogenase formation chaperone, partial [Gammaproteobacteria bacterium]